jgi:hypothetical protein
MYTMRRCLLICMLFFAAASFAGSIDESVLAALNQHGISSAPICSDAVFVRRVHLDLLGMLPSAGEVRSFLGDARPEKRAVLIDQLLERSEFADYWAMKWCDLLRVKSEFPINLWPNAVQSYHRWVRSSFTENMPYDRFAREALVSSGSNFRVPPVNFYRAVRDRKPETIAQAVALTFMGVRTESWTPERVAGMASFFQDVQYKKSAEWKEEIRDALYRGREDFVYRIAIGELPYIESIFPLGCRRGDEVLLELSGWNLPETNRIFALPKEGPASIRVSTGGLISNRVPFDTGILPEEFDTEPNNDVSRAQPVVLPVTVNGRIVFRCDEHSAVPGTSGNLIVNAYAVRDPETMKGRGQRKKPRQLLTALPAVSFRIVE